MKTLEKYIYEKADVLQAVLAAHQAAKGAAPEGYQWQARAVRGGVVVEQVKQ